MRILLVDDELSNVVSLANAIRHGGYQIRTVADPLEALALNRAEPFDVVISDVRMPEMSGIELLQAIRAEQPEARVILITGYSDPETAMAAITHHAWAMLRKPVSVATVMDCLSSIQRDIAQ